MPFPRPVSEEPGSSSLAQSVMSMVSSQSQHSQVSTDTVSSMSGSYVAPGTEEEGEALPYPRATSRGPSEDGEVREGAGTPHGSEVLQTRPFGTPSVPGTWLGFAARLGGRSSRWSAP